MIVTVEKARGMLCQEAIGEVNRCCTPLACMAWEFWISPPGTAYMEKVEHGIPDEKKLGYCGKVVRR